MRSFYIVLIVAGVLVLLTILGIILLTVRKRWANRKVQKSSEQEKMQRLDKALSAFGFCYDRENDAISSGMYPWQREMGYCKAYDAAAATMYMIFDCEPIYFDYGGGRYLIELWKGQYGCTTGAEIGVYVNRDGKMTEDPAELFYDSVSDEERLVLQFVLYRNGKKILERIALHWWLTGFQVGVFSDKSTLAMDVGIEFPNTGMRNAFCEGLMRAGYGWSTIRVQQNRVYFRFDTPHSEQPEKCGKWCRKWIMRRNRKNCKLYNQVTKAFDTTLDKINYIGYCFPLLYRIIIRMGMKSNRRKVQKYKKKFIK